MVVGTPGSVVSALQRRRLVLQHVAVFVLDEADAMLEVKRVNIGFSKGRFKRSKFYSQISNF